ncbi:MAG TPA: ATPase, T2SS/T4P/T4SS family, partial [Candidatus Saccharimonadales bacterium]|nr:ATPase, T2SS/T4P/T4SS family [Candidatus Saccharimonadales bacterium]
MVGIGDTELYQILSELEYIPAEELNKVQANARAGDMPLYEALLKSNVISDVDLGKVIAYYLKLPFVSLSQSSVSEDSLRIIPESVAAEFKVITFAVEDGVLKLASSNPKQTDLFDMLAKKAGAKSYRLFFATEQDINEALRLYKKGINEVFEGLLAENANGKTEVPVAKIVDMLIEYAYLNKASDVHIEPSRASSQVRFRIDGVLHDMVGLPRALHEQVITRIKVMSRLRTDEHYSAQDGRMHVKLEAESIDVRVSVVPIVPGEKVV